MKKDDNGYYYSDVPWRYTGLRPKLFGLDPLALLLIPAALAGLRSGASVIYFFLLISITGLFIYSSFKGYPSLYMYLHAMHTRFIRRCQWKVR